MIENKTEEFLFDDLGYPAEQTLKIISDVDKWVDDWDGLLAFVKQGWRNADYGYWHEEEVEVKHYGQVKRYTISTTGWSGNKELIRAMKENHLFWMFNWVQSRRGGHYIFELRKENETHTSPDQS